MKTHVLCLILLVPFLFACSESNVRQASKEFSDLPAPVQKTVRAKVPNAEVADVERRERGGHTTYLIQFRDARLHPDMEVAADGTLVKYEAGTAVFGQPGQGEATVRGGSKTDLSALPVEVQKAIRKNAPTADVVDIRRREHNGAVIYEVEYAGNEPRRVLEVAADGTIVKDLLPRSDR